MIVNTNWLKKYTDYSYSAEELAERLTAIGLESNLIPDKAAGLEEVLIAEILAVNPHPNADRLTVCIVTTGEKQFAVVCGAPNVKKGLKVPLALVGSTLPNGMILKPIKIRGVASEGMLCAEDELGISEDHSGIMILDENAIVGGRLADYLASNDRSLEIDLTPNRPDCTSHIGVAREIALMTGNELYKPDINLSESESATSAYISVGIEDQIGCPRYAARLVQGVKIGPSPDWLVKALASIGQRSINNVVDAANYVLMETGHPLHTFDYANLKGQKIVVRRAKAGEKVVTLDGIERELSDDILLICDGERPVAIAGIMGLANSEIEKDTRDVLIESAYFNPRIIRRGSRYLGLQTEASYRFERGADYEGAIYALERGAELIAEVAGGRVCRGVVDEYPKPIESPKIVLRYERTNRLIGMKFEPEWVKKVLVGLGCDILNSNAQEVAVRVPSWRPDLEREIDLIEEVVRIYGMSRVPSTKTLQMIPNISTDDRYDRIEKLRSFMATCGYSELYCNSLVSARATEFGFEPVKPVKLRNPLSQDMTFLRTSLIPGMIAAIKHNFNRRRFDLRLFELGHVQAYAPEEETQARESLRLGALLTGYFDEPNWAYPRRKTNSFILKGLADTLAHEFGVCNLNYSKAENLFFKRLVKISAGKKVLGYFGELAPDYLGKDWDIEEPVFGMELDADFLLKQVNLAKIYKEPPVFPSTERDLSIVVKCEILVGDIMKKIRQNGGDLLREIRFYDLYLGKNVDKNEKSLTFNLLFQADDRTLTDAEVDQIMATIHSNLSRELNARLR
ncbi:MAG: phenylalanine--tRNA ligase subunit beta [Candidatus Marinimicrobia bacterium]|nr:phenylalanine--tRNA ligase subunit beta [Candidatus Neomarinimicrobiota bacterium]MCK9483357.1 phenylalanine--tRNA ligase subunit beta [Candidatus Neomarinimicrobiota bacterium]